MDLHEEFRKWAFDRHGQDPDVLPIREAQNLYIEWVNDSEPMRNSRREVEQWVTEEGFWGIYEAVTKTFPHLTPAQVMHFIMVLDTTNKSLFEAEKVKTRRQQTDALDSEDPTDGGST